MQKTKEKLEVALEKLQDCTYPPLHTSSHEDDSLMQQLTAECILFLIQKSTLHVIVCFFVALLNLPSNYFS